jgi:hypothetical protein
MKEQTEPQVTRLCLDDAESARQVAQGEEWPAVREAILADLAEGPETTGFATVPEPDFGEAFMSQWQALPRLNLTRLAGGLGGPDTLPAVGPSDPSHSA